MAHGHQPAPIPATGSGHRFGLRNATTAVPAVYDHIDIFAGLSRRRLLKLGELLSVVDLAPGALVGRQGDPCREFAVIVAGAVAVSVDDQPLAVLDTGCHFGEIGLLDGVDKRRRATVVTLEGTRFGVANRREFATMMDAFPTVADRVVAMADRRSSYIEGVRHGVASIMAAEVRFPAHLDEVAGERIAV